MYKAVLTCTMSEMVAVTFRDGENRMQCRGGLRSVLASLNRQGKMPGRRHFDIDASHKRLPEMKCLSLNFIVNITETNKSSGVAAWLRQLISRLTNVDGP